MTAAQFMANQAQSEYNRLMRERIQQGSQRIRRLTARLRFGLKQCIKALRRGWLKLNSLNLPLSPIQWILLFYILLGIGYMTAAPSLKPMTKSGTLATSSICAKPAPCRINSQTAPNKPSTDSTAASHRSIMR